MRRLLLVFVAGCSLRTPQKSPDAAAIDAVLPDAGIRDARADAREHDAPIDGDPTKQPRIDAAPRD